MNFVELQISGVFKGFRSLVERLRDEILEVSAPTLRREEEASIKQRFYRTGAGLRSLQDEVITDGDRKIYRLFPTLFYMAFGEYGTGRRGAVTGRPAPRGWRYGKRAGMDARRYSRLAVAKARPEIERHTKRRTQAFLRNVTVN